MGEHGGGQASVLLLSERQAFLDPLSQAFSAAGLVIVVARDIEAAAAAFAGDHGPAGVVIDLLTVDDDDAGDICDRLRDAPGAASIPILFIGTGEGAIASTTDALIAGGDGYFQIPVEAGRVTAKIAAYVGAPTPTLPPGLLVTMDTDDVADRPPGPALVVPPAALPADLLGEDDDFASPWAATEPDALHPEPDDGGLGELAAILHEPGSALSGEAEPEAPSSTTPAPASALAEVTMPMTSGSLQQRVTRETSFAGVGAAPVPRDVDDDDALPTAVTVVAALARAANPDRAAIEEDNDEHTPDFDAPTTGSLLVTVRAEEERLAALRAKRTAATEEAAARGRRRAEQIAAEEARIAELQRARIAEEEALALVVEDGEREAAVADARVVALQEVRTATEADLARLARLAAERARRIAEEEAAIAGLAARRSEREGAIETLRQDAENALAIEDARLRALMEVRAAAEADIAALDVARQEREAAVAALRAEQQARVAEEEAHLHALAEVRGIAEAELAELATEHAQRRAAEEARLIALQDARAHSEAAIEALRDQQLERVAGEEARLMALAEARARAEAELEDLTRREAEQRAAIEARLADLAVASDEAEAALRALAEDRARRLANETERLAALQADKDATEGALARLQEEQQRTLAAEEARLQALVDERTATEQALAAMQREQDVRQQTHDDALDALATRRAEVEAEQVRLHGEVAQRVAEEAAAFEALAARKSALEDELRAAEAARAARIAEEAAELEALQQRRIDAVADDDAAAAAREARRAKEEATLAELIRRREAVDGDVAAAEDAAQKRALQEEQRLGELAVRLREAKAALKDAEGTREQHRAGEEARLQALRDERDAREAEIQRLADEDAARRDRAAQDLAWLAAERQALETALTELSARSQHEEQQARARVAELEVARLRTEEEIARLTREAQERELSARASLDAIQSAQRAAMTAHEERQASLKAAILAEEERLDTLERERLAQEVQARDADVERQQRLRAQEHHLEELQRLTDQAAADRERIGRDVAVAEAALQAQETRARERLDALAREQQQLQDEARAEAERLARLRAQEEAARAALEDARARARLAFTTGRFDALPAGVQVGGFDVGAAPRPAGDGEGVPFGGPLVGVDLDEREPPPPMAFVALEPPEGRFVDGELPSLLLAAWSQRVTGAIELRVDDDRLRTIFLEDGEPVFVGSALPADRTEEQLLKGGFITAARHAELRVGEALSARRLCARLVDDGLLKLDELFPAVRGVLTEQLLRLFEWGDGSFRFVEARAHAVDRVRLEHRFEAVIAEGVRRKYDEGRLWAVLGGPATLLGAADVSRPLPPLSPEERTVVERLDGTRSLDDLVFGSGLHAHVVLRAGLLAVASGAVRVLARGLPRSVDDALTRRQREIAIDRDRVRDKLALARHGDYFSFLGVEPSATPFEIHRASARLRERFDPARYSDAAFADLGAALREILDVVGDAEAVLADPALKDAYRLNLRAQARGVGTGHRARTA